MIHGKRQVEPFICACLVLLVLFPTGWETKAPQPGGAVTMELQKDSFCPLEWTIAEFKYNFNRQFNDLLFQAQQVRKANSRHARNQPDNTEIAEVLEDAIVQARSAMPVDEMEEGLLSFYRAAGL